MKLNNKKSLWEYLKHYISFNGEFIPPHKLEYDIIHDGYGNTCSAHCIECGEYSLEYVNKGKVKCKNCG